MGRRLGYTDEALADLSAIRGWLTEPGSGAAAERKLAAIRAAIRKLRNHPDLCAVGAHPGVRELPCEGDIGRNDTAGDVRVFGPG